MKVKELGLITPLGKIVIGNKTDEDTTITPEVLQELGEDWEKVLTQSTCFKFQTHSGRYHIIPKEVLQHSYAYVDLEEENNG